MLLDWFRKWRARNDAERRAIEHVRNERAGEFLRGAVCGVDETERFVVRVFVGRRSAGGLALRLPPWRECIIVAVPKAPRSEPSILEGEENATYSPRLR